MAARMTELGVPGWRRSDGEAKIERREAVECWAAAGVVPAPTMPPFTAAVPRPCPRPQPPVSPPRTPPRLLLGFRSMFAGLTCNMQCHRSALRRLALRRSSKMRSGGCGNARQQRRWSSAALWRRRLSSAESRRCLSGTGRQRLGSCEQRCAAAARLSGARQRFTAAEAGPCVLRVCSGALDCRALRVQWAALQVCKPGMEAGSWRCAVTGTVLRHRGGSGGQGRDQGIRGRIGRGGIKTGGGAANSVCSDRRGR